MFAGILRKLGYCQRSWRIFSKNFFLSLDVINDLSEVELGRFLGTMAATSLPRMSKCSNMDLLR